MINKYSNSYYEYIRPNEFIIALFILIFLIFFPTSSFFFKIILTWVILFIIFRQITNSLSIALFISLGLSFLLLIYKSINPYSLVLEGYDNKPTDANTNANPDAGDNTEKHIPNSFPSDDSKPNESLDEVMKDNNDDEDSEEDDGMDSFAGPKDVDGEDILTPQKLRKDALYNQDEIRKGQKDLYTINKGIRELKASLSSLGPALKDSKNVLNLFKDFDLFKNIS